MVENIIIILKIIIKIIFIFILLIRLYERIISIIFEKFNQKNIIPDDADININKESEISKFKFMLPSLTPDFKFFPSSINAIFNARQIYISDIRITP